MADRARYAANSDGKTERRRERRAAESCEQRETRLARRRVADRARFAARTGILYMYITKYGCVFLKHGESTCIYVAMDLIPILVYSWVRSRWPIMLSIHLIIHRCCGRGIRGITTPKNIHVHRWVSKERVEGQGAMISTILSLVAFLSVLVFLYRCRGSSRRSKTAVGYRRVRQKKEEEGRVNVLVTGAEGALASHVVERLIKDGGYNVHCLDLRIPKEEQRNHDVCSFFFLFFLFIFFYESLCCKYSKDTQNSRVIANINVFQLH